MNLSFYDAHNHLQDARLVPYLPSIITELERLPVRRVVVNGTQPSDWPAVARLAEQYSWIIPSYGLHPWYVNQSCENWRADLASRLENPAAALGEIGLDRWIENHDSEQQELAFVAQLQLARKLRRPVTIHCLKAWGRLLEILQSEDLPSGFLLHSYGGPAEMVQQFIALGGYFSLSGYFAHERKARQREVFRTIPLDRLLLETDAPDMLPPEAHQSSFFQNREAKNLHHPANIAAIYTFAAQLYNLTVQELALRVERNFLALFQPALSPVSQSPIDNR